MDSIIADDCITEFTLIYHQKSNNSKWGLTEKKKLDIDSLICGWCQYTNLDWDTQALLLKTYKELSLTPEG